MKEKVASFDAENLFNNAIFGDNTTVLVGNSSTQTVSSINLKGNFEALKQTLSNNGISDNDINDLKAALEEDSKVKGPPAKPEAYWVTPSKGFL